MIEVESQNDILLIEQHWELVTIIHSYKLQGTDVQMPIYIEFYKKIGENPKCPCNKNHLSYINNIRDNLDKYLKPEEIQKIKQEEDVKIIHVKRTDGTILEF